MFSQILQFERDEDNPDKGEDCTESDVQKYIAAKESELAFAEAAEDKDMGGRRLAQAQEVTKEVEPAVEEGEVTKD